MEKRNIKAEIEEFVKDMLGEDEVEFEEGFEFIDLRDAPDDAIERYLAGEDVPGMKVLWRLGDDEEEESASGS